MKNKDHRTSTVGAAITSLEELPNPAVITDIPREYENPVPIFNRILIKKGAKETIWGDQKIVIPEFIQKAPNQGAVVAASEFYIVDGKKFPMDELVKQGDLVTFGQFNVEDIQLDGEDFVLCDIFDIKLIHRVSYAVTAKS